MTVDWDFGDGNTATAPVEEPVTHTYTEPGEHVVTATVGSRPVEGATAAARSRNLLADDQSASFEGGRGTWDRGTVSSDQARHGASSLRYSPTQNGQYLATSQVSPPVLIGGRLLTVMAAIWSPLVPRLGVNFYNEAGTSVGSGSTELPGEVDEWTHLRFEVTPDPSAVRFLLTARPRLNTQAGDVYYLDRVGVFLGSVPWEGWSLPSEFVP